MSLPQLEQNLVGTHVYPVTDLDMDMVLGAAGVTNGTNFSTGVPATLLVLVELVTGDATLRASLNDGTGYDTADLTMALSGTSLLAGTLDTDITYDDSTGDPTTVSVNNLYVAVRVTAGGSGVEIGDFAILALYELEPGEDWFLGLRSSAMAVSIKNSAYDGNGWVSLDPEAPVADYPL